MLFRRLDLSPEGEGGGGDAPMIRVEVDGKAVDVPLPAGYLTKVDVDAKYVPKGAHNDQMGRLRKDLDALKGLKPPEELLNDPEFKEKAVKSWGLNGATGEQFQEQLNRAKTDLFEREVKPRDVKLTKATQEIDTLRVKDLRGQIIQAAAALKVDDKFTRPPAKGADPLIFAMLRPLFDFDAEHREWFAKGPNGFAYSQQEGGAPYMPVMEFMTGWVGGDGKDFLRSQRQAGAEAEADGGVPGQVGKELRLTEAQIRDTAYFTRARVRAEKEGLTIVQV